MKPQIKEEKYLDKLLRHKTAFLNRMYKNLIKTNLNKTHIVIGPKSVDRRLLEGSSPLDIKLQLYVRCEFKY